MHNKNVVFNVYSIFYIGMCTYIIATYLMLIVLFLQSTCTYLHIGTYG